MLVRQPRPGQEPRPIEEIALEEIGKAAFLNLQNALSLTEEDLVAQTARLIGYPHAGERVRRRILTALARLEQTGRIERNNGKLTLRPPSPAQPSLARVDRVGIGKRDCLAQRPYEITDGSLGGLRYPATSVKFDSPPLPSRARHTRPVSHQIGIAVPAALDRIQRRGGLLDPFADGKPTFPVCQFALNQVPLIHARPCVFAVAH